MGKVSSTQLVFVSMFYVCSRRSVLRQVPIPFANNVFRKV